MAEPVRTMMLPPGARIGVVMVSTVGNAVHTLPVLVSLKRHDPTCRITWILQPGSRALVEGHPAVDEVIEYDRAAGIRGFLRLRRALRDRAFDVVLNLQSYLKSGLVTALTRAPVRLGYDRKRAKEGTWLFSTHRLAPRPRAHTQDEYLEFLEALGVEPILEWGLVPGSDGAERYADLHPARRPWAAVVLATTRPERDWDAERYAELCRRLPAELGVGVVLVGGRSPREEAVAHRLAEIPDPPLDARAWDLPRLTYLLAGADVVVTPDTGPLHLAIALGTPTVSLVGFTNPKRTGPYGRYLDLMVDGFGDPGEAYTAAAPWRPGRMARITVDAVVEKVRLALERYPRGGTVPEAAAAPDPPVEA